MDVEAGVVYIKSVCERLSRPEKNYVRCKSRFMVHSQDSNWKLPKCHSKYPQDADLIVVTIIIIICSSIMLSFIYLKCRL